MYNWNLQCGTSFEVLCCELEREKGFSQYLLPEQKTRGLQMRTSGLFGVLVEEPSDR